MKVVLSFCLAALSLTFLTFRNFQNKKIQLLKDGNYLVNKGAPVLQDDAQQLFDLTRTTASETTVVHTTVWQHKNTTRLKVNGLLITKASAASETTIVHETIYKHKDASKLSMTDKEIARVKTIMEKYSK